MDLVIKNGKIVNPTGIVSAAIGVDKGKIVAIANEEALPSADRTIDAAGKYVLPGVLDMHCHPCNFDPFALYVKSESQACALGGVTTLGTYLMPPGRKALVDTFDGFKKDWETLSILDGVFHMLVTTDPRREELS